MTEAAASAAVGGATEANMGAELLGQFLQQILGMISESVGKFNLRRMSKGVYILRCPNYAEETAAPAPRTT